MGRLAFLFPGQGAQHVGMGRDLCEQFPTARALFEQADRQLGFELSRICFEGPEERLNATDVSQPAIFVHSAALLAVLGEQPNWQGMRPDVTAGLSLGEYTALYAADAMDFQVALNLVAQRGRFMQQASEASPSGMVSIMGLDEEKVAELCAAAAGGQVLAPANFNCPGQIVISGHADACRRAVELADRFGARAIPLRVAGAFHTELMASAAEKLAEVIAASEIRLPRAEVLSNVTGEPYDSVESIRGGLVRQVTCPIRWLQSMRRMIADGVGRCLEIGPGRVLTGLMRKIDRGLAVTNLSGAESPAGAAKP